MRVQTLHDEGPHPYSCDDSPVPGRKNNSKCYIKPPKILCKFMVYASFTDVVAGSRLVAGKVELYLYQY